MVVEGGGGEGGESGKLFCIRVNASGPLSNKDLSLII